MQLSHFVDCILNSSCNKNRVDWTEFAKQHQTCYIDQCENNVKKRIKSHSNASKRPLKPHKGADIHCFLV